MSFQIERSRRALIHQEDHLAPRLCERRPCTRARRLVRRRVASPHVVRCDHLVRRKYRTNLAVELIESLCRERLRRGRMRNVERLALLRLHQHVNRQMPRVRLRPVAHNLQARSERLAGAVLVQVLHMHHLESRLEHHVRIRIRRHPPAHRPPLQAPALQDAHSAHPCCRQRYPARSAAHRRRTAYPAADVRSPVRADASGFFAPR